MIAIAKWYLNLLPAYPGEYLLREVPFEKPMMEYSDECSEFGFHRLFNHSLEFEGKSVLDLGCGNGGRTVRYKELGASRAVGLEVSQKMVVEARDFAASRGVEIEIVLGKGESLPFPDDSFDTICSYDVFEHVESVDLCVQECYRVLKPGGTLYAVFPPFYHPTHGSHFSGYISHAPFDTLLFSPRTLMQAAEQIMVERNYTYRPNPLRPTDKIWVMNGITLGKFRRILRAVPFSEKRVIYDPLLSPLRRQWKRWHMRYYAWPFWVGSQIPIVNEICTHRIVAQLTK